MVDIELINESPCNATGVLKIDTNLKEISTVFSGQDRNYTL